MAGNVTIWVADLLNRADMASPVELDSLGLEALEWLLTLAECIQPSQPPELSALLWQQSRLDGSLPAAALSYYYDFGKPAPGPLLRADPVYLEADRDCVRLLTTCLPDLTHEQATQLIAEINDQFSAEPWRLVLGTAQRWYLLLDNAAGITTQAPEQVLGRNIIDFMPVGERQSYWRNIFNEMQMLLFSSSVNQQRQEDGQQLASSLWLWGESAAHDPGAEALLLPCAAIYSDDPVALGLGLQAGLVTGAAPATASKLLETAPAAGQIHCQLSLPAGIQALQAFNHDWALPLYKALQRGFFRDQEGHSLASVELLTASGVCYRLSAGKRRWWRRRRRIDRFLE